jgi:2-succinyl-5-enolpyruvyl-6-hydroxy-3-cyclohexene-1-carboxylate synthase
MEAEAAAPGLWAAQQALLERLQGNPSKASSSSIRESVVVGGEREHEPARDHVPLCWLRAQATRAPSLSRCFFRLPDGSYAAGGVGVAHLVEGAGMIDPSCKSSNLHAGARYIGGCRFDPGAVSEVGHNSCWSGFGRELGSGHLFMLPLVEVQWLRGRLTLAVNLRWELGKSTRDDVVADAISALRMLNFSCPIPRRGAHCPCPLPPPVGESDGTSRTEWGESVSSILGAISKGVVQKAVLARQHQLRFAAPLESMDLLWNLRNHPGYLFMLQPGAEGLAFLGVSPERLFRWGDGELLTEALAGTRARGQTEDEDAYLAEELLASAKDASENDVTLAYIEECLRQAGLVVTASDDEMHILKLKHVLHLRREILAVQGPENHVDALSLLHVLHPTPAVCGSPLEPALALLRQLELLSGHLDRGFYAGPFGFMEGGGRNAEFCVAIRSALLHHKGRFLSIFAGAGIVNGSTAEGEWEETGEGAKMKGFTSLFESRCDTIVQSPNINTAWGALAVAELVRCGVSTFCVCPGSRSTPITVAIARHPYARSIVHHDERGAAFFAVGFARATGKPCAVVTSSGTAVANLLPGLIEAEVAGLPAIFITADRPPEMRDRGCNQTINQVGIFGHHARWFADMPCPDDAIPVESILSDICYSVAMANGVVGQDRASAGPVHINFMFRENLAPEAGPVRDSGNLKLSSEWDRRCFEGPAISRWLLTAEPITSWTDGSSDLQHMPLMGSILRHISCARNGLIVVGDLKKGGDELSSVLWLAQKLQWPIFADIASGLRSCLYSHGTGIGAYEALLREPLVAASLLPDVVLQLGRPLVSKVLQSSMAKWAVAASAVIMVSSMDRRHDPERCISHHLVCSVSTFVKAVAVHSQWAEGSDPQRRPYSSSRLLKPLRKLSACIDTCWTRSLNSADTSPSLRLSEPMIARIVSEMLPPRHGLFLSNSMPCRDMDAFASMCSGPSYLTDVALNRGASGIDGVISSAIGYACGLGAEVTLVIGDMAVLHDIGSLHILSRCPSPSPPLCIICVNNGGGGIFSFLPIAKREHADVFSPFFDTPHDTSFAGVCHSFGLQYFEATSGTALRDAYEQALVSAKHTFIEAFVPPGGEKNVQVHK